jgi:hypothetical protein
MGDLAVVVVVVPFFVNGKGWNGHGVGSGGRENVGKALGMVIVMAPAESLARTKVVELASLVVSHGMTWSQLLQTVGHPERDQLH